MPFEAAFGRKPNLWCVHEWGEKVWVCIKKGNKLGGRAKEGRWLGIDEHSKEYWIYWPDTRTVTVEHNVYHNEACQSVDHLKGEDWDFKPKTEAMPSPDVHTPRVPAPEPAAPTIASTENPETHPLFLLIRIPLKMMLSLLGILDDLLSVFVTLLRGME